MTTRDINRRDPARPRLVPCGLLVFALSACGTQGDIDNGQALGAEGVGNDVSRVRGINQPDDRSRRGREDGRNRGPDFRSIDGSRNNERDEEFGAAGTRLNRWMPSQYDDDISAIAGLNRPSAREVSNAVNAQLETEPNTLGASDFLWQWGQFLDHDIDLTDGADPPEPAAISVPTGDPFFDPDSTGTAEIDFNRSIYDPTTGLSSDDPRQQLNEVTHWIDASNVYGSDDERAGELRANDGSGKLLMSEGGLLPFNEPGLPNAGGDSPTLFLAGDVRANEQVGLTALHTLFVREHNRLADEIREREPNLPGDEIYERARQIVGAQMQVITYREYLPALLGGNTLRPYEGYDPNVHPGIANVFSAAIYRYGHSALSATLLRLDGNGNEIEDGHLALRDAFFNPSVIQADGIAPLLRGLAAQQCQRIDTQLVDDVRNFLFGPPGAGGFDLASLNIQRGRDHGIPRYNAVRVSMGLEPAESFADVTSDPSTQARLAQVYDAPDDMDVWAGGLAEEPVNGGHVGELMFTVMKRQFERLRDGDRFWYATTLPDDRRREVEGTRLADIIRRNTEIRSELDDNVFRVR